MPPKYKVGDKFVNKFSGIAYYVTHVDTKRNLDDTEPRYFYKLSVLSGDYLEEKCVTDSYTYEKQ